MLQDTIIHYTDDSGQARKARGTWFDRKTSYEGFISIVNSTKPGRPFRLEIKDSDGGFVDFDESYLETYRPYGLRTTLPITTDRASERKPAAVELNIVRLPSMTEYRFLKKLFVFFDVSRFSARIL